MHQQQTNTIEPMGNHLLGNTTRSETFKCDDYSIILNKKGADHYPKITYPLHRGIYSEIKTREICLHFNLNGEIARAAGVGRSWNHPSEWLKRTMGNDWTYYSTGGYSGVFEAIGEYYLPNLPYPTNNLIGGSPFKENAVKKVINTWHQTIENINRLAGKHPQDIRLLLEKALDNDPETLKTKADRFFKLSGGRVTVLPPDARVCDYDIVPVTIADGCLYHCRFCRVKNRAGFALKSRQQIKQQIADLKQHYARDMVNYNALFLGEHDALNAPCDLILFAATEAYGQFNFKDSYLKECSLFLFGSIDALLNADARLFDQLEALPYFTYINIGLESGDQKTLDLLGKPVTKKQVETAFRKIQEINTRYTTIEITSNFIMDDRLPESHYQAFEELVGKTAKTPRSKGSIYLSPLRVNSPSREELLKFYRLKNLSRFPTFLYIIQRL